jgi:hypothetical protein
MESIPFYVSTVFIVTTLATLFFLYRSTRSKTILWISIALLILQGVTGLSDFFTVTSGLPPRFLLLVVPPLLGIIALLVLPAGRRLIDQFDPKWLTWLNTVRLPAEITLLWLFLYKQVPQLMTFEGRNFDILSGLSAPFIAWFGYHKQKLGRVVLLGWNIICLGLLLNIVINAVLSAPFPFQQFAFDQPNVAVLYFPFVWLPGFIVPAVLLSHLVNIRLLRKSQTEGHRISFARLK